MMKCPYCGHMNDWSKNRCQNCGADVAYLRERVFPGRQFAFFEASEEQPILVELTPACQSGGRGHRFTEPVIVSRHEHSISLGEKPPTRLDQPPWPRWRGPRGSIQIPSYLPSLDLPRLDLVTVVTDRKIYRPEDEVHIFVVGLNTAGQEAELEIKLAGQRVHHARVTLYEAGLHLHRFAELEEGEYTVSVTLPGRPTAQAECTFSCAEFTLSPLIATLESHTFEHNLLSFVLELTQLIVPYSGPVELALRSGDRVVQTSEGRVRDGRLEAQFDLERKAWQALTVEVTTPEGNTATVAFPSTGWRERQKITLSPLDPPVEAALLPFREAEASIRGLHYARQREEDTPFALQSVVASEGRIEALRGAQLVHLLVFDPFSGAHRKLEFHEVKAGDVLSFEVDSPYSVFTLGAFMDRGLPYEAWGVVIQPVNLEASLDVPEETEPGALISTRVGTDRPAHCLLLVYDARLEHEDPLPRLAQRIFHQVQDGTQKLGAQRLKEAAKASWEQMWTWEDAEWPVMVRSAMPKGLMFRAMDTLGVAVAPEVAVEEAVSTTLLTLLVAPREAFPELAYIELFPVDGTVEKLIRLGDQIGTWRCRAYFFRDYDYVALTQDVEAALDLYAECDLPAIVGEGDEIFAQARYHAADQATLTITTPTAQIEQIVEGDGMVEVPLTAPGQVMAYIAAGDRSDTSQRTVDAPGQETVTVSRLALLQRGETASGKRVVVFPSIGPLLQGTIEALIHYPFG
jgi:hypothetical protein